MSDLADAFFASMKPLDNEDFCVHGHDTYTSRRLFPAKIPTTACKYCGVTNLEWKGNKEDNGEVIWKLYDKQGIQHKCNKTHALAESSWDINTNNVTYRKDGTMSQKVIQVVFTESDFKGAKPYSYFTDDPTIKENDYALVVVSGVPKVVRVTATSGLSRDAINKASKWIVGKIDLTAYEERQVRLQQLVELRNQLRQRREEMEDMAIYKMLAKDDPIMEELLKKMQALDSSMSMLTAPDKPEVPPMDF